MERFVHLHTHSHYSLLNALPKIPDLVGAAERNGMRSIALTDLGNLYGAIEFYKECHRRGIKPILGVEAYLGSRSRFDKQPGIDSKRTRLIFLARDLTGYRNLIKMVTLSHLEGFYYKPRLDRELIERYREGLICISPAMGSHISLALENRNGERAAEFARWLQGVFGASLFIELTHHPEIENHASLITALIEFARRLRIQTVAAHEVYYIEEQERVARETLLSIQSGGDYESKRERGSENFSFLTPTQICDSFSETPAAIENTERISDLCSFSLELGRWVFPNYEIPKGLTHNEELRRLVKDGLLSRGIAETQEVKERLEYELGVISQKSFAPYFLVVSDLLRHARKNGIMTTTRGSVAGSLVSYLTYITTVNPIEYRLPFERFLNPERPSAPDIDMDIADNRREEMIEYAKRKYGPDRVAQIGTFGTMMARGSVRDVARALGYPYSVGDRIAKLIPFGAQGFPMTIDRALSEVTDLKSLLVEDKTTQEIIAMARKIEGCARHISVHAAGVVIAPAPLIEFVPLQLDPKGGKLITQYDMYAIEDAGLLKFDFLGIKNLSILADAVSLAEQHKGVNIEIERIPLDDAKTFETLAKGETSGLFQLSGAGMTRYLKDLKPTTIHDINAMVALYRPGPMESIPLYIECKHNPKLVSYLDPRLKDILERSFGVITYQDDVMLIALKLAGYSWLEADKLRKAMGKKIPKEMRAQRDKLVAGLVENGMILKKAEELWRLIEPFAAYGFNKSHAASYGKVAYQTAYMKANFPALYMCAVLTADSGDVEKIAESIAECTRLEIAVLQPNVNESFEGFTVIEHDGNEAIRFGLTTIKNFGEGVARAIIEERQKNGAFTSLSNFLRRIRDKNLNRKSLESLIKAGALDEFAERGAMLQNLERLLEYNREEAQIPSAQDSLFTLMGETLPELPLAPTLPASTDEMLAWERELLGLYISGHPLDKFRNLFEKREMNIRTIKESMREGMLAVIGGIIEEAKQVITKTGDPMMFLRLSDLSGSIEAVAFPRVCSEFRSLLAVHNCVAIRGRISERNGTFSLIAEKVKKLT